MLTSKPGLGVAHRTSTPEDENEIAAVPPVRVNVWVVAAGIAGAVGAGAGVVGVGWVDGVAVGAGRAGGAVVGCGVGWFAGAGLDGAAVACVARFDAVGWSLPPLGSSIWSAVADELGASRGVVVAPSVAGRSLTDVVALVVGEVSSVAEGGSTTWLSTTDTPAQATPTAAALPASHIENSMSFFMEPVSLLALDGRVNATLNEP
jgi:hypothetical protein